MGVNVSPKPILLYNTIYKEQSLFNWLDKVYHILKNFMDYSNP